MEVTRVRSQEHKSQHRRAEKDECLNFLRFHLSLRKMASGNVVNEILHKEMKSFKLHFTFKRDCPYHLSSSYCVKYFFTLLEDSQDCTILINTSPPF
ncbi:hypothetical protein J6590_057302 [Homalodisca vitripennis]|nr:hypothetical protein J6590_057302 [Homalodisca vitripennis]